MFHNDIYKFYAKSEYKLGVTELHISKCCVIKTIRNCVIVL